MSDFLEILSKDSFDHADLVAILSFEDTAMIEAVRAAAEKVLLAECGSDVFFRGLIEASNYCVRDCLYCGIRKSNLSVNRYEMDVPEIVDVAKWCADNGYGSVVIQTGERQDPTFVDLIVEAVEEVKKTTRSADLPDGVGITLSVGEQTEETYRRFFAAGAHRYLLRIETTNPDLFARLHPPAQKFETRRDCLRVLRSIGFQVGTGVMIGLPGQTAEDLARDILFFRDEDVAMIGMGPFIPHPATPVAHQECPDVATRLRLSFLMIAATRLVLRDVNIAAATALQALDPKGREKALRYGANVMMPLMTPPTLRRNYQLYPGKPCLDEVSEACRPCLEIRISGVGRVIGTNKWGDAPHATRGRAR